MALIDDLLTELNQAKVIETARVAGGEDLLDIRSGSSTLTPETVAILQEKLVHETEQLSLINAAINSLENLAKHSYPIRKVFSIQPTIADELALKQKQMQEFAAELLPVILGADAAVITVATQQPKVLVQKSRK